MGRLIDADVLQEHFEKVKKESASLVNLAHIIGFQSVIDSQPTAYDVDKAVEEIEAKVYKDAVCVGCGYLKDNICTYKGSACGVSKPMLESIKKVFEEIRKGGV